MFKTLMVASMSLAIIAGAGTLAFLVVAAVMTSWAYLGFAFLAAVCTIGFGAGAAGCSNAGKTNKVFSNLAEQEVLTVKQRRDLKKARGSVVMQKAMTDVENERENLAQRQLESRRDGDKPPHDTDFSRVYPDVTPDQTRRLR